MKRARLHQSPIAPQKAATNQIPVISHKVSQALTTRSSRVKFKLFDNLFQVSNMEHDLSKVPQPNNIHNPYGYATTSYNQGQPYMMAANPPLPTHPGFHQKPPPPAFPSMNHMPPTQPPLPQQMRYPADQTRYAAPSVNSFYPPNNYPHKNRSSSHYHQPYHQ